MATKGFRGDVDNTIPFTNAYPIGRSYGSVPAAASDFSFRNNYSGEIGGLNQDFSSMQTPFSQASAAAMPPTQAEKTTGVLGKPANYWLTFFLIFVAFYFVAKRYAPEGENYANIKLSVINGVFLTLYIVLILTLLKTIFAKIRVPGLSDLILAA